MGHLFLGGWVVPHGGGNASLGLILRFLESRLESSFDCSLGYPTLLSPGYRPFLIERSSCQDAMRLYYVCTAPHCGHRWTE